MASSSRASKTSLRKRLNQSKISDEIDRISDLPDSILCHILSFLRAKESVQTCVLSKRWKDLWMDVPSLYLRYDFGEDFDFERFVTMWLVKSQSLNKLILPYVVADPFYVTSWLSTAIAKNVQVLELGFYDDAIDSIPLPGNFFTCSSLTSLKLEGDFLVQVPSLVSLPRLECLSFIGVQFECDESVPKLIQGCPVLNSLCIERNRIKRNRFDNVMVFTVTSPTLRHLRIRAGFFPSHVFSILVINAFSKLEINAPLLDLHLGDCVSNEFSIQSLPFLVELHLDNDYNLPRYDCNRFLKLVRQLHCLKNLTLGDIDYGEFSLAAARSSEKFLSLRKLTLMSRFFEWKCLLRILECLIHLEVLELKLCDFGYSICDDDATLYDVDADADADVPRCLSSSLQRISITVCRENDIEMIKYFLKHGGLLKRVELHNTERFLGYDELKKILTFSRKSDACEVHVFEGSPVAPCGMFI